jgi:hypothetical protein
LYISRIVVVLVLVVDYNDIIKIHSSGSKTENHKPGTEEIPRRRYLVKNDYREESKGSRENT